MKIYYIGTTLECLKSILNDNCIKTNPPERVWKKHSKSFIYMIPSEHEEEDCDILLQFAIEQSDFSIYELDHTKRVILVIQGIDENLLSNDEDCADIYAVKYSTNIHISNIVKILVEKTDNSHRIKQSVALINLLKEENSIHLDLLRTTHLFSKEINKYNFPIKHIEKLDLDLIFNPKIDMHEFLFETLEELDSQHLFDSYQLKELMENH